MYIDNKIFFISQNCKKKQKLKKNTHKKMYVAFVCYVHKGKLNIKKLI